MDFHSNRPLQTGSPPPRHLGQPTKPHILHIWSVPPATPSDPMSVLPGTQRVRATCPRHSTRPKSAHSSLRHPSLATPQPPECVNVTPPPRDGSPRPTLASLPPRESEPMPSAIPWPMLARDTAHCFFIIHSLSAQCLDILHLWQLSPGGTIPLSTLHCTLYTGKDYQPPSPIDRNCQSLGTVTSTWSSAPLTTLHPFSSR